MMRISCWQNVSKQLAIKMALSHLLLGLIAASFGLFDQNCHVIRSPETNIITIASVMVSLQEYQTNKVSSSAPIITQPKSSYLKLIPATNFLYQQIIPVVRLTPYNGIRAGPILLS